MSTIKGQYLYITVNLGINYDNDTVYSCSFSLDSNLYLNDYDGIINVKHHEYDPQIGDKLYFMPGVNIPRIKLKDLALNYNTKTVRDPLEANVIFAGTNTAAKITDSTWEYSIPTELFKEFYNCVEHLLDDHDKENFKTALEFYDKPIILTDWATCNKLEDQDLNIYKGQVKNLGKSIQISRESHRIYKINSEHLSLYNKIKDIEIYSETALLDKLNGKDSVIIDSEVYDQLEAMLKSTDEDNHVMAMEIMANCNYRESLLYLGILFKEYPHKFANCSSKNHVNFKSLLAYLDKTTSSMNVDLDYIVDIMIKKNVLTDDKAKILLDRYQHEIMRYGDTKYFNVKTITMNTETLKILNSNFVYQVLDDFIPVEVETVENLPEAEEEVKWT